jgi:hypothetical protein
MQLNYNIILLLLISFCSLKVSIVRVHLNIIFWFYYTFQLFGHKDVYHLPLMR